MSRFTRRTARVAVLLGLFVMFATQPAAAQTTTGTLRGSVNDGGGNGLPGATVEATNDDSGTTRVAVTGTDGFYNLSVTPGNYTVKANLQDVGEET